MLELVIGVKAKSTIHNLISELRSLDLEGTLYIGYPILATPDETTFIDAMLVSDQYGAVVFDLEQNDPKSEGFWDALAARQDSIYSAVYQKLFMHEELRERRKLAVEISIVTFLPYDATPPPAKQDILVAGPQALADLLASLPAIDRKYIRPLNAAVQRVTMIKPRKRRSSVKRDDSRGAALKRIEREIANLDRWQNHAAIETPEGAQRIRGLAGSGKTVVLALKAAYLHVQNPEWRIAITFHTRSLYQQFEDLVRRFTFEHTMDEPDLSRLRILHAWGSASREGMYFEIASRCGVEPRDFGYARQRYGWQGAFAGVCQELSEAIERRDIDPIYDIVLIDEAQDFPGPFFRLVHRAVAAPKRIVWAYDELQNLGDFRMTPPEELFGVDSQNRPLVTLHNREGQARQDIILPVCYRNTPWALATAHALGFGIYRDKGIVQYFDEPQLWYKMGYEVIGGENAPGKQVTLARRSDAAPAFFEELLDPSDTVMCQVFEDRGEQAAWVADSIKDNLTKDELEFSDVLIILPDAYSAQSEAKVIIDALRQRGLDAHLAGVTSSKDELFLDDSIAIAHIHRAKGNEAPMVYVLNSQYCFEGPELHKRRNILFTAITRSRAWVRICGYGAAMQDLKTEIDKVVNGDFRLEFCVPTQAELDQIRQIHRDMTKEEQEEIRRMEATFAKYVASVESGDLGEDVLPRELRDRLREILEENDARSHQDRNRQTNS
jgi:superfamily I DNA and RNA helicase